MQHMLDILSTARRVESVIDQGCALAITCSPSSTSASLLLVNVDFRLPTKFLVPYLRSDRIDLFVKYMHEVCALCGQHAPWVRDFDPLTILAAQIAEGITYLQANVNFKSAESALSKLVRFVPPRERGCG